MQVSLVSQSSAVEHKQGTAKSTGRFESSSYLQQITCLCAFTSRSHRSTDTGAMKLETTAKPLLASRLLINLPFCRWPVSSVKFKNQANATVTQCSYDTCSCSHCKYTMTKNASIKRT